MKPLGGGEKPIGRQEVANYANTEVKYSRLRGLGSTKCLHQKLSRHGYTMNRKEVSVAEAKYSKRKMVKDEVRGRKGLDCMYLVTWYFILNVLESLWVFVLFCFDK